MSQTSSPSAAPSPHVVHRAVSYAQSPPHPSSPPSNPMSVHTPGMSSPSQSSSSSRTPLPQLWQALVSYAQSSPHPSSPPTNPSATQSLGTVARSQTSSSSSSLLPQRLQSSSTYALHPALQRSVPPKNPGWSAQVTSPVSSPSHSSGPSMRSLPHGRRCPRDGSVISTAGGFGCPRRHSPSGSPSSSPFV